MKTTAFLFDERCYWHGGGNYALLAPVGGLVQPLVAGGLPEAPEGKRRLKNLMDVTGLSHELDCYSAPEASYEDLLRVHTATYLRDFKKLSDKGGGELGLRTPFGRGAFEIAALSSGLVKRAAENVLGPKVVKNAYALSRPPGHHCLPDWPNGFCLLNNIAIAIEAVKAKGLAERFAVVDWDVHHGNGTEAIFYKRSDVLTISIHQERCYPQDTGDIEDRGAGAGEGYNMNIPLPPGAGHATYLEVMDRLVVPSLAAYDADLIFIACGFDASGFDPLGRMMCSAETYREMTKRIMSVSDGRFVAAHEGGYSEMYVPFCGHAMIEEMASSVARAEDPLAQRITKQQPNSHMQRVYSGLISDMAVHFGL